MRNLPIPPQPGHTLALKAIWRDDPGLSSGLCLAVKLAALRYAAAGIDPREAMGRAAYEADVEGAPLYHDGTPRRAWSGLCAVARDSWRRNPTVRAGSGVEQIAARERASRAGKAGERLTMRDGSQWFHPYDGGAPVSE